MRLRENGDNVYARSCYHKREAYLHENLVGTGIGVDPKGAVIRTFGHGIGQSISTRLPQANTYGIIGPRGSGWD